MNGLLAIIRSEMRQRARSVIGAILIASLGVGLILCTAAGARRTATAFPRLIEQHDGAHVVIPNYQFLDFAATFSAEQVRALPQVESMSAARWGVFARGLWLAPLDAEYGRTVNRWKVIRGRLADPARADEAVASQAWAEENNVTVGEVIDIPGSREELANFSIDADPVASVTVVGLVVGPGEFPPISEDRPSVFMTPAFAEQVPQRIKGTFKEIDVPLVFDGGRLIVHVREGEERAFRNEIERLAAGKTVILESQRIADERSGRSADLQAIALGLLSLLAGIAVVLVIAQIVLRLIVVAASDHPVLRALGLGRGTLFGISMARASVILLPSLIFGGTLAFLASGLFPLGFARSAEPEPGLMFDPLAIAGGAAAILVVCLLFVAQPAWRASGAGARLTPAAFGARPSALATLVGKLRSGPSMSGGIRLALEGGQGQRAVPVRSAIAGVMLSIAAVAASLTFGNSLSGLLEDPALYGRTFDMWVANDPEGFPARRHLPALLADADITGVAIGTPGDSAPVEGRELDLMPFEAITPSIGLRYLEGRSPRGDREIALGARTAADLDTSVGEQVTVKLQEGPIEAEVVGIAVVPPLTDRSGLGEGAIVHPSFFDVIQEGIGEGGAFLTLRPGADPDVVLARLQKATGIDSLYRDSFKAPTDVVNFARVESLPLLLSAALGLIAVATLAHTVLSAVRRRRRDLAIFKTLGLMRGGTGAMVFWQATTIVAFAAALGIPTGIAGGRALWLLFAGRIGVVGIARVPVEQVLLIAPAALVIGWLVALLPARTAARTQPAIVLRTE